MTILSYFLIGTIWGFFTMVFNKFLSERDENVPKFTNLENILMIFLWPFYVILFFYFLIKK